MLSEVSNLQELKPEKLCGWIKYKPTQHESLQVLLSQKVL